MDSAGPRRVSLKAHRADWKSELRTNCLRRVRKDRTDLLWKIRKQGQLPANDIPLSDLEKVESAVRNIISDEIEKLKQSNKGNEDQEMDVIWEYQGLQAAKPAQIESEDILLEMERLLYEDIREELISKRVAAESAKLWCPVCKRGDLRETHNLIYCTLCKLRLDLGEDKMTLEFLQERLANAHTDHFDRGCKSAPKFCLQTMFGLTALYIQCEECSTLDIVV